MTRRVTFSTQAQGDLFQIYSYVAERSGRERALTYTDRITAYCEGFAEFPERGTRRNDLFPGLRVIGFERRITLAFHVTADTVTIDRILYGGQNLEAALAEDA